MRLRSTFRWFDIWIGVFIDLDDRAAYICPLPMWCIKVTWGGTEECAIDALAARVRELEAQRDSFKKRMNLVAADRDKALGERESARQRAAILRAEVVRVEAENARLREALDKIVQQREDLCPEDGWAANIAADALREGRERKE